MSSTEDQPAEPEEDVIVDPETGEEKRIDRGEESESEEKDEGAA